MRDTLTLTYRKVGQYGEVGLVRDPGSFKYDDWSTNLTGLLILISLCLHCQLITLRPALTQLRHLGYFLIICTSHTSKHTQAISGISTSQWLA